MDSDEDHFTTTLKDLPPEIITLITTKGYDFQAMTNFALTSEENLKITKNAFERDNMCTQAMKRDYGAYKSLCTDKVTDTKDQKYNVLQPCTKKEDLLDRVCPGAKCDWKMAHIRQILFFLNFSYDDLEDATGTPWRLVCQTPYEKIIQDLIFWTDQHNPDKYWKAVEIIKRVTPNHTYDYDNNEVYYLGKYLNEPMWFQEYEDEMEEKRGDYGELNESISQETIGGILERDQLEHGYSEILKKYVQKELNKVWWERVEPLFNT